MMWEACADRVRERGSTTESYQTYIIAGASLIRSRRRRSGAGYPALAGGSLRWASGLAR